MKYTRPNRSESGVSLIEIVVYMGIAAIMGVVLMQQFGNYYKMKGRHDTDRAREEIAHVLRVRLDCEETRASTPANCFSNRSMVALRDSRGEPFVKKYGAGSVTRIGGYQVRFQCTSRPYLYRAQLRTGRNDTWKSVFRIPIAC